VAAGVSRGIVKERSLLMLAFEFPPLSTVGVQRSLKLAKYLPEHGITPVVITTDGASLQRWFGRTLDDRPLAELRPGTTIHRVACPKRDLSRTLWGRRLRRLFSLEDEDIGHRWEAPLIEHWDRIVADAAPAALYVSVPPFSVATLAVKLARRSGLPLILDFRDSWSQWCNSPRQSWMHYQLVLRAERSALEAACAVVATTGQINRELQAAHPHVPRDRFHVIPNGYDAQLPEAIAPPRADHAPFVIGYVGSFYYLPEMRASVMDPWWRLPARHWLHYSPRQQDWLYRTPYFFFRALARLLSARPELRSRIKVRFAGDREDWLMAQVEAFGLQDVVEHLGRLTLAESLAFQSTCDALLSTSAKTIGGRDPFLAGKTFEYVTSGRPVLAFVADGEQKDFWQASGMAMLCDPDDPAASAANLERLITGGFTARPNRAFLLRFNRRETARQLAALVEACS
jgi:glycosyltransferase involved in cell wall biosynthesis